MSVAAEDCIVEPQQAHEQWEAPKFDTESRHKSKRQDRRNLLPAKVHANSEGSLYYRADYEVRWLRVARKCRNEWTRVFGRAGREKDVATQALASRHLLDWCERERSILRISKPAAVAVKERKGTVPMAVIEG